MTNASAAIIVTQIQRKIRNCCTSANLIAGAYGSHSAHQLKEELSTIQTDLAELQYYLQQEANKHPQGGAQK